MTSNLGRAVSFYPSLARVFDDISTALLICQFMYWRKKVGGREIYKTQEEIEVETGIKAGAQRRIFKNLQKDGFVQIVKKGMPAKNYYKWNWEQIDSFINEFLCAEKSGNTANKKEVEKEEKDAHQSCRNDSTSPTESVEQDVSKQQNKTYRNSTTSSIESTALVLPNQQHLCYRNGRTTSEITQEITTETTTHKQTDIAQPIVKKDDRSDVVDDVEKSFNKFWIAGMVKINKKTSFARYKTRLKESGMKPNDFAEMLTNDVQARIKAEQLGFDKMHPTTYLNGNRWEDEIVSNKKTVFDPLEHMRNQNRNRDNRNEISENSESVLDIQARVIQ